MAAWGHGETQRLSFWDPGPSDPVPLPLTLRLCAAADGLCLVPSCVCCKSLSACVLGESLAPRFQKQGLRAVLEGPPRPHGEQGVVTEVGGRALLCLLSPGPRPQACLRSCCWVLRVASKRVHASSSKVGRRAQPLSALQTGEGELGAGGQPGGAGAAERRLWACGRAPDDTNGDELRLQRDTPEGRGTGGHSGQAARLTGRAAQSGASPESVLATSPPRGMR